MLKQILRLRVEGVLLLCVFLVLSGLVNCMSVAENPVSFTAGDIKDGMSSLLSKLREEKISPNFLQSQPAIRPVQLPFSGFIQNRGQLSDKTIHYYYSSGRVSVSFGTSRITFVSMVPEDQIPVVFAITFPGSQPVVPIGCKKTSHYINYFHGNLTVTNVPTYEEIWYKELYPGIDLRYYMSDQGLKYEFVVHPGADPSQITLQVSESMVLAIDDQSVSIRAPSHPKTVCFQDTALRVFHASIPTEIGARFISRHGVPNGYGFQVEVFDPTQTLVIDPVLSFSTFLGGNGDDWGYDIAVDAAGNSYITGWTNSSNFPLKNAYESMGSFDVFVTKLNATGTGLVFSTYLGGDSGKDEGNGIAIDTAGNSYIIGWTNSADFPTKNAYNSTLGGSHSAFVTKLNATGNGLVFSTYLGGDSIDIGWDIAVDAAGNCTVIGHTESSNFPTKNAYDSTRNGYMDVFVTKFNTTGNGLVFSTYVGGSYPDYGFSIAMDDDGFIYITGHTISSNFPTKNAYNSTMGTADAFVTKLSATGDEILFSTFLGGEYNETGYGISVDAYGNSYIAGYTASPNFPTKNAYNSTYGGNGNGDAGDGFVTKLNATGNGLNFSTFLGGNKYDTAYSIAVDAAGNSYITGFTQSPDFPMQNAYNNTYGGNRDAFVAMLSTAGNDLLFSTFLGGNGFDLGRGIAIDNAKSGYITGKTKSNNFPTVNAFNDTYGGGYTDSFVVKFEFAFPPVITTRPTQLNATEGVWFAYDFNASSTPPGPLTWTLWGNGTAWLTINSSTGVVTGTPDYLVGESWNVTVVVTDVNGLNATYTVPLKVQFVVLVFDEVSPDQNVWLFDVVTLKVRVNTTDGQPRPDVPVDWWLDGEQLGTNDTNANGFSYWTLQLITVRTYQLLAQVPARSLSTEIQITVDPLSFWFNGQANETEPVWLPLGANYTIAGQLVDGEGQPVDGIELSYKLNDYSFTPLVTDANGWVNLTQPFLSEGTYVLTVTKDGQELFMNGQRAELIIHVLATPTVVEQITPATNTTETVVNRPTVFVARIYFDELTPVALPGARIGLLVNGSLVDSQFSDANGYVTFAYTFLTSGTYFVTFYYNGRSWGGVWVTVTMGYFAVWLGETPVNGTVGQPLEFTIYVQTNTTLTRGLILYMNNGTPVIGAAIDWYINDVYQETTMTGAEGATTFRHTFSTLGQYTIVAKHEGQVLATFVVTITEAPLWEFISEHFGLLVLLLVISALLVVGSRIPVVRQKTQRVLRRFRTKLERRALSTAAFYAREFAPELEESLGRQTLETARIDPRQKERVRRKVSTLLLRDPEIRGLPRQDRLKLVDQTTEQVLARYRQKEADKS